METIKLNKKQLKIINPMSNMIVGYRSTLSDLATMRGHVEVRLFEELRKMFSELKDKDFVYDHKNRLVEIEGE